MPARFLLACHPHKLRCIPAKNTCVLFILATRCISCFAPSLTFTGVLTDVKESSSHYPTSRRSSLHHVTLGRKYFHPFGAHIISEPWGILNKYIHITVYTTPDTSNNSRHNQQRNSYEYVFLLQTHNYFVIFSYTDKLANKLSFIYTLLFIFFLIKYEDLLLHFILLPASLITNKTLLVRVRI